MADRIATLDSWLVQAIGGSTKYGNGTGGLVHVGRVPSGTSDPDWKSRSVFKIPLRESGSGILDGLSSVSAATFELTVGPNTCIVGGRGSVFYAFLEEMTGSFTEYNAGGTCNFGSAGPASGEWGTDTATTTNRAFKSSPGLAQNDKVSWNILAMIQAALADTSQTDLWIRIIYANSAGTAYDETSGAAKGTSFYSTEEGDSSKRPVLHVTGSAAGVDKSDTDTITIAETASKTTGGTTPGDDDSITISDAVVYAGPAPLWSITTNRGSVYLPDDAMSTRAHLDDVSEDDINMHIKFVVDKVPLNGQLYFNELARVQSDGQCYVAQCIMRSNPTQSIGVQIGKNTTGAIGATPILISYVPDIRVLAVGNAYHLRFVVQGLSPTSLLAKLWRDTEQEPTGYQVTGQDSEAALQAVGSVGLEAKVAVNVSNVPITIYIDDFEVKAP